jgi:hypothetical protein
MTPQIAGAAAEQESESEKSSSSNDGDSFSPPSPPILTGLNIDVWFI